MRRAEVARTTGERLAGHAYKARTVHVHERPARRDPLRLVRVKCTDSACWYARREDARHKR